MIRAALAGLVPVGVGLVFQAGAAPSPAPPLHLDATTPQVSSPFDHQEHAGLFPTCTGCHAGAAAGAEPLFPDPALCATCHTGDEELEPVDWLQPATVATNLSFDHGDHRAVAARVEAASPTCVDCHGAMATPGVTRAAFDTCVSCHAHPAESHYDDASCATCHTALSRNRLAATAIEAFPRPPDHDRPGFLAAEHGAGLYQADRCATCHTADRCAACHVDAGSAEIEALGYAAPDRAMPAFAAHYPVPGDHREPGWMTEHGQGPPNASDCATCHTRDDCAVCHVAPATWPRAIEALPVASSVAAPGAEVARTQPANHGQPAFVTDHRIPATVSQGSCTTCHEEDRCVACHEDTREAAFHPPGYEAGHAADAFGSMLDCGSCHDAVVFCRACHTEAGLGDRRLGVDYHDAEPLWLLRHGQAARQGLETCVSCHEQRDCTRCHSAVGAFRVSPHGPDFDARAAWEKNFRACASCHLGDPFPS